MSLELELTLDRQRIVAGEDLSFRLTVRNRGGADETVRDPSLDDEWPKLEVLEPSGYRVAYGGRADGGQDEHNFVFPPVPERVTLAPGQEASSDERMLAWVGPLAPGTYTARASIEADGMALRAAPSPLEVEPLSATRVQIIGPHAGPGTLAYAVVTHREPDGSSHLLSWLHQLDQEGHLHTSVVQRLGAVGPEAVVSVTRAGLPYPGQWIVWTEADRLRGFYQMQGNPGQPVDGVLSAPAEIIEPVLVELEGCDGSAPPRAEVLIHTPGRAYVALIAPDGTVTEGASWDLEGALEWAWATLPESNVREAFLALDTDDGLEVVRLCWDADQRPSGPVSLAKRPGCRVLGGGATIGADGGVYGAIVTRRDRDEPPAAYELMRFGVGPGGQPVAEAKAITMDPPRDFVRALVGVRPDGAAQALLQAVGGVWWSTSTGLATPCRPFSGEALAVHFWGASPAVLLAVERGLEYQGFAR